MTSAVIDLDALAMKRDGTGHSIFSPSSSAMWLTCSGSLIPNILADDKAGEDAAYGTVAHSLAEQWLKTGVRPSERIGTNEFIESGDWGYLIEIDDEMMAYVKEAVDYCQFLSGDHFVEQKVYFSHLTPLRHQGGTADHVACTPGRMVITDHKFGKGVRVDAQENTQGLLYALGTFYGRDIDYDFQEIVIRISQPRLDHFDEWTTTRQYLLEFAEYVRERSHAAWQPHAPRKPSPKACQWCKVSATCAANAKLQEDLVAAAFADLDGGEVSSESMTDLRERLADPLSVYALRTADVATLTTAEMATLLHYRTAAEKWWNCLADELYRRACAGEEVPGFKLVESRSRRVFSNKKRAERRLIELGLKRSQIVEDVLVSPNQAEVLLRKSGHSAKTIPDLLHAWIYKPAGKPTLAPLHDKREAIADVSSIAFRDIATFETEEN